MKRLIVLLVAALFVAALPALAEPMSYLDYTDDLLEDGSPIYYFPELSLTLPADWQGKVMALREESGTSFYQKASYEKYQAEGLDGGGFLFALGASVNNSFSELPAFEYIGFSEASAMNYYLALPTDYPAYNDEAIRAEYDAMYSEIGFVAEHAEFYAGSTAQGDVPAVTDAEEAAWTPARARYQFEHSILPRYFYEDPQNMLDTIGRVGVYALWQSIATENGIDPTYPAGDYVERWYTAGDGAVLLQALQPQPDDNTLCYRIYFVYDAAAGNAGYYTVEYDNLLGEAAFLCGWSQAHEHVNYGGAAILDPAGDDREAALEAEAAQVAELAGISGALVPGDARTEAPDDGLAVIECPEQGFSTLADPAYAWDYREGTGISIYTQSAGSIPYVIVYRAEDLIVEAYEYIVEQYTPHIKNQYGEDLVEYTEYEAYDIGGKALPAGLYTYRLQGYLIDLLRLYDSTGDRTVAYTAKYILGEGDATLAALDAAVRGFRTE